MLMRIVIFDFKYFTEKYIILSGFIFIQNETIANLNRKNSMRIKHLLLFAFKS